MAVACTLFAYLVGLFSLVIVGTSDMSLLAKLIFGAFAVWLWRDLIVLLRAEGEDEGEAEADAAGAAGAAGASAAAGPAHLHHHPAH